MIDRATESLTMQDLAAAAEVIGQRLTGRLLRLKTISASVRPSVYPDPDPLIPSSQLGIILFRTGKMGLYYQSALNCWNTQNV